MKVAKKLQETWKVNQKSEVKGEPGKGDFWRSGQYCPNPEKKDHWKGHGI